MRKASKIILISLLALTFILSFFIASFYILTKNAKLDKNKLITSSRNIEFYDINNNLLETKSYGNSITKIETIPQYVINAFISIEDKRFYSHSGIDLKGIIRAFSANLFSFSFKQGGSTINQQLIKNSHLTNEKTIKRKLNEMRLALELNKKFSKNEILEIYLNTIYFGNNCYGITKASEFYFDKEVKELTIDEGALLAGIIKAPTTYSPITQLSNAIKRRNLVLKQMEEQGYISQSEYATYSNIRPTIANNTITNQYDYVSLASSDISKLLDNNPYYYNLKVKTFFNPNYQQIIKNILSADKNEYEKCAIILNKSGEVLSYYSTCDEAIRQMGSVIKPILVYGPAIENNIIHSCSLINDEKTNFNGYSPSNYNNVYYGNISAKTALAKSLNIPAIKILQANGIKNAVNFAKKTQIPFSDDDNSLCLALGATKNGASLRQIAYSYTTFLNNGTFKKTGLIKSISNGIKIEKTETKVFNEDTTFILNDMLRETVKNGTAKKLLIDNVAVYAKTGTVGGKNGNTDAYCISFTKDYVLATWCGAKQGFMDNKITGGLVPAEMSREIWKKIYYNKESEEFTAPSSVVKLDIDKIAYDEEGNIILANKNIPKRYVISEYFKKNSAPKNISTNFINPVLENCNLSLNNNGIIISLCQTKYYNLKLYRIEDNNKKLIGNFNTQTEALSYLDKDVLPNKQYEYSIVPYFINNGNEILCKEIIIGKIKTPIKNIGANDWWNDDLE